VPISSAILGVALILFGCSHWLRLSLLLMGFAGFGLMKNIAASNTLIQTLVPEDKRARVVGYYVMVLFGAAPIGSLLVGILAQKVGASHAIMATGVLSLFSTLWFLWEMPKIREVTLPIYKQMGLVAI
jgi:predicted MFS family arabinose efflux permease